MIRSVGGRPDTGSVILTSHLRGLKVQEKGALTCQLILRQVSELGVRADLLVRRETRQCRAVGQSEVSTAHVVHSMLLVVLYQCPVIVAEQVSDGHTVLVAQWQTHWVAVHNVALRKRVHAQHFLKPYQTVELTESRNGSKIRIKSQFEISVLASHILYDWNLFLIY